MNKYDNMILEDLIDDLKSIESELLNKESVQDNDERVLKLVTKYCDKENYNHAERMDIIQEGGSSDDNIEISQSEIDQQEGFYVQKFTFGNRAS